MKFQNVKIVGELVPISQYRAETKKRGGDGYTMSRGELMDFLLNPHKWLCGLGGDESTKSTVWGNLMDTLVLTPEQFDKLYVVAPETYPSRGMQCPRCKTITTAKTCRECKVDRVEIITEKAWDFNATYCAEWREKQIGKEIIKAELKTKAYEALEILHMHDNVMDFIKCSRKQVMILAEYHDEATDIVVPVKALLDMVPNKKHSKYGKCLGDLKELMTVQPRPLEKTIFNWNYDAQAAFYQDLYIAATSEDRPDWRFVAQENEPPFEVANPMPLMSSAFLDIGRAKYTFALKFYAHCLATESFPSYSIGVRSQIDDAYIVEPEAWMVEAAVDWPKLSPPKTIPNEPSNDITP